jgi:hypothetical protein
VEGNLIINIEKFENPPLVITMSQIEITKGGIFMEKTRKVDYQLSNAY